MSDQFDVWTYNDTDEWLESNTVPDMRLVYGVDRHRADTAARLLAQRFPAATFEVRSTMGDTIVSYGAPREEREPHPVPVSPLRTRRSLGGRGR